MLHYLSVAISLLLAVPTYGISLVLLFLVVKHLNKLGARLVINAIYRSLQEGQVVEIPHRNYMTIRKAYQLLGAEGVEEQFFAGLRLKSFTGVVHHHRHPYPIVTHIQVAHLPGPAMVSIAAEDLSLREGGEELINALLDSVTKAPISATSPQPAQGGPPRAM